MKANKGSIGRMVDQPGRDTRLFLFHGQDEGQSRALANRLLTALGATRFVIAGAALKSDPAALADEAGAMSLFGGPRAIWVEPAGEEIVAAVEALFEAPPGESPVIAIAGTLRPTSGLRKLAEASPHAIAYCAYLPEGRDAEQMVIDVGRTLGLKIDRSVAARVADAAGSDQAIATQELSKLALYLDASPQAPKELTHETVDAVGAAMPEGDFLRLADMALAGDLRGLAGELAHLSSRGAEAVPVVRSLQRRLLMLAPARARVERGEDPGAVMASMGKSLFFKDKDLVGGLIATWDAKGLAKAAERIGELERDLMFSDAPPSAALGEELAAIARAARRR